MEGEKSHFFMSQLFESRNELPGPNFNNCLAAMAEDRKNLSKGCSDCESQGKMRLWFALWPSENLHQGRGADRAQGALLRRKSLVCSAFIGKSQHRHAHPQPLPYSPFVLSSLDLLKQNKTPKMHTHSLTHTHTN